MELEYTPRPQFSFHLEDSNFQKLKSLYYCIDIAEVRTEQVYLFVAIDLKLFLYN